MVYISSFSSSFSLSLYLSNMESSKTLGCSYNIKGMGHEGGDISLSWFNDNNTHDRKWPDIKLLYFVYRVSPKRLPNLSILKSELIRGLLWIKLQQENSISDRLLASFYKMFLGCWYVWYIKTLQDITETNSFFTFEFCLD